MCRTNFGAGKYQRLRKAFRSTITLSTAAMCLVTIVILYNSESLLLFRDDPEVIAIGLRTWRIQALAQLFLPVCMATEMLYQCTGRKSGALTLSVMQNGLFMISALFFLERWRGLAGIQEAQGAVCVMTLIPAMWMAIRFFRGLSGGSAADEPSKQFLE